MAIIREILDGIPTDAAVEVVQDRAAAIAYAVGSAQNNDVILVAGRGHETRQLKGQQAIPFSDAMVARQALGAER